MVEKDVTVAAREIPQITRNTFEPKRFLESEVIDGDTKRTIVEITLDTEICPLYLHVVLVSPPVFNYYI